MKNRDNSKKLTLALIIMLTIVSSAIICFFFTGHDNGPASIAMYIVLTVILFCTLALYYIVRFRIFMPIEKMTAIVDNMADGSLTSEECFIEDSAALTDLSNAVQRLNGNLCSFVNFMEIVADKDMSQIITPRSDNDVIARTFTHMLQANGETLSQIGSVAEYIAKRSKEMLTSGLNLSMSSTEQAGAVEEITATITEIAIQSKQISENSRSAKQFSDDITGFAQDSNTKMSNMLDAMSIIKEAASNISHIIKTIDEIAFQTNILAINASVEAARAGQEGKGFAVVANEVRSLAGRSVSAAKETEELIIQTIEKVTVGANIAEETAGALSKILEAVAQNAPLIDSISVATDEQYLGIEQMNIALEQVAKVTEQNSRFAEESASASEKLTHQVEIMYGLLSEYKLDDSYKSCTLSQLDPPLTAMKPTKKTEIEISLEDGDFGKY